MITTTKNFIASYALFIFAITIPTVSLAQGNTAEALIQSIIQEQVTAWNAGDAKMYSSHFAKEGTFTNIRGDFFVGYPMFLERHEQIFRTIFKGTKLDNKVTSLRFVKADVVVVEAMCTVSGFAVPPTGIRLNAEGKLVTRLLQVVVKDGDDWKIEAYHNVDIKPAPPAAPEKK